MAMWTKGSGTNSVNPPVSRCRARVRTMWRAQLIGCSTEPNMIVMLERRPTEWAVRCASSHSSVEILSGQMRARTSSSRISAAVPGRVLSPASRSRVRYSASGTPERRAPSVTSSAVKPWMWMVAEPARTASSTWR